MIIIYIPHRYIIDYIYIYIHAYASNYVYYPCTLGVV